MSNYPERINDLLAEFSTPEPTCDEIIALRLGDGQPSQGEGPPDQSTATATSNTNNKAGTILYFPHAGGGHVLVIGASATPWALESDPRLSGLLHRALSCFAFDQGCPTPSVVPTIMDLLLEPR